MLTEKGVYDEGYWQSCLEHSIYIDGCADCLKAWLRWYFAEAPRFEPAVKQERWYLEGWHRARRDVSARIGSDKNDGTTTGQSEPEATE